MNRRLFLQQSSIALAAVSGLPKAVRQQQTTVTLYKTELKAGISGQTFYAIKINHSALQNFSLATDDEKAVGLQVNYYSGADFTLPTQSSEFKFILKEVKLSNAASGIYLAKAKLDTKKGDYTLPKEYDKTIILEIKFNSYANVLSKNGKSQLVHIPFPVSNSKTATGDCFLTTACVAYKGLQDDCDDLQLLRFLRDSYMMASKETIQLAINYKTVGPQLVMAINECANREEIYHYLYAHMIVPAVKLVKEKKFSQATNHYSLFVRALQKNYC